MNDATRTHSSDAPAVVLVRPKLPENVGAAARAMKNFGFQRLLLVAPRCRLDRRAYALATHAGDVLDAAETVPSLTESLRGITFAVATGAAERAHDVPPERSVDDALMVLPAGTGALVFGPEDHGLSNEEMERCQARVRIPTAAYASINLAQAVNLLACRWFALVRAVDHTPAARERADREQMERMYAQLQRLWLEIGYTDELRMGATLRLFRGLLDRAEPSPREVAALRGLWSQAQWALGRAREGGLQDGADALADDGNAR